MLVLVCTAGDRVPVLLFQQSRLASAESVRPAGGSGLPAGALHRQGSLLSLSLTRQGTGHGGVARQTLQGENR